MRTRFETPLPRLRLYPRGGLQHDGPRVRPCCWCSGRCCPGVAHRVVPLADGAVRARRLRARRRRPEVHRLRRPRSGSSHDLAVVALIVILFRDGLEVEGEMLQKRVAAAAAQARAGDADHVRRSSPLATHALTARRHGRQSFLLGALLSPTDPVLSSTVVTNPRVPRLVRHSLNLESGLNDGLALPAVLAFAAALVADQAGLRVVAVRAPGRRRSGFAFGIAIGFIASRLIPRGRGLEEQVGPHVEVAVRAGRGVRDLRRDRAGAARQRPDRHLRVRDHARHPPRRHPRGLRARVGRASSRSSSSGSSWCSARCSPLDGLFGDGWAAVAIVAVTLLVARPVAVGLALAGTKHRRARRARSWPGSAPRAWPRWRSRCSCSARASRAPSASSTSRRWPCSLDHRARADRHPGRELDRARQRAAPGAARPYACSAACSWAEGTTTRRACGAPGGRLKRSCCGRPQSVGRVGPEGRTGLAQFQRTQAVAAEEAFLTRHLALVPQPCAIFAERPCHR